MKAIGITTYGGPEVLHLVDLPDPQAGPEQVRVRVQTAAVNPADVMLREGLLADWYAGAEKPFIPGMDIAGVIDQVGPEVDPHLALEAGQFVTGIVDNYGPYGGYSQYVVLPAASVTAAPRGATAPEAAAFLMPALTARAGLDNLALPTGSTLLVAGAAGGVGRYAVALAHAAGLVVVAIASPGDADLVGRLGARVFIQRGEDAADRVRAQFPHGVDAVFDNTTSPERFYSAVRDGGQILSPRGAATEPGRGINVASVNVRQHVTDSAAIARLREQVEGGILPAQVAATFPYMQATDAHRLFDAGRIRGRIIVDFGNA
ncbi:NADP-dependent oxidoreductase [Streptomyces sp. NPDC048219]|uniref:NADP-dependent oxidoreductase n=1 Tax=Streptomyces sp. NPDC048219 TaxID=3365517 RepID=UPI0037172E8F